MCKKAYTNIWILRRMKALKMDPFTILDYYFKEIRVHLELAVPVWHSGLTVRLSADIDLSSGLLSVLSLGKLSSTTVVAVPCWVLSLCTFGGRSSVNVSPAKRLPLSVDIMTFSKLKLLDMIQEAMHIENTFVTLPDFTIVHCLF